MKLGLDLDSEERARAENEIRVSKNGDATAGEAIHDVTRGRDQVFPQNGPKYPAAPVPHRD